MTDNYLKMKMPFHRSNRDLNTHTQPDLLGSTEEAGSGGKMSAFAALLPITAAKHFSLCGSV